MMSGGPLRLKGWKKSIVLLVGRRIIQCALILAILLPISCTSLTSPPSLPIKIPNRPALDGSQRVDGDRVSLSLSQWTALREWWLGLERELKTACLALGGSSAECKTE